MKVIQQSQPIYQQIYELIKHLIISGQIKPGSRINASKLAEEYGISRTPLREALRQLQKEQLLIQNNQGATVIELDQKDFEELCSSRLLLEREIIRLAVKEISDIELKKIDNIVTKAESLLEPGEDGHSFLELNTKFHEIIIHSISNKRLIQLLDQVRSLLLLYRATIVNYSDHYAEIIKEHRMILEALNDRDEEKAVRLVEEHLKNDQIRGQKYFETENISKKGD
ncbi:GntR family transcriptional regulator [Peribacillus aracenensis]|uniref:GntR family transcriptional regulator n=1 Tax=Peribacillus aracenensis TaxID=2976708 RepID=UPI0021A6DAAE|nr:GntR family transcriptional regulator [Peribacillus sp. BBB004]